MGDPLERDPEMVMKDIQNGLISPEKALEDYGVVVGTEAGSLLREPTLETRKSRSATGN